MAPEPTLSPDEVFLLKKYRELKATAHDFRLEVFGGFKHKERTIEVRPAPYYRLTIPSLTEAAFEAVD